MSGKTGKNSSAFLARLIEGNDGDVPSQDAGLTQPKELHFFSWSTFGEISQMLAVFLIRRASAVARARPRSEFSDGQ